MSLLRRWDRVDATLVDSRHHARKLYSSDGAGGSYEVREYMVDVPARDGGAPVRLTFKMQSFRVRGNPKPGDVVPVIVNRRRTKAKFNLADPRIDAEGHMQEQERRRKAKEDARFEARRAGREP
jgi:hypothetical protein